MKKKLKTLTVLILVFNYCIGQSSLFYSQAQETRHQKGKINSVLIDHRTGTRFVLDSTRRTISAIAKNGKVIWRTNPEEDYGLTLRYYHPQILYFYFESSKETNHIQRIIIEYTGSFTGIIDKKTGKLCSSFQD